MKKLVSIIIISLWAVASLMAQTGPGGVGNSSNNILWLKADAITGVSDGGSITDWLDQSGNGNNFTQTNGSRKPKWTQSNADFNGRPTVTFDGADDYFALVTSPLNNSKINYTLFFVYKSTSTANQFLHDSQKGRLKIPHYGGGDRAFHDGKARGVEITGADTKLVVWELINNNNSGIYENGLKTQSGLDYAQREMKDKNNIGAQENGGGKFFNGNIAEAIFFANNTNNAQRIIIENYLAAKYGLTIENNKYAHGSTHGNDVAGIGREDASNIHGEAQSAGILTIFEAVALGNDDYLLFGHDNASIGSWSTTETPHIDVRRINREWRFTETGETGNTSVKIDTAALPAMPSGFTKYCILVTNDGDFTSGVTVHPLHLVGGEYIAEDVSISDGDYVTIGVWKPTVAFQTPAMSGFEDETPVTVVIDMNYTLNTDVTVDYIVTGGTATGGGVDYTLADGTATITAGNTSFSFDITIIDDTDIEPDETIIITLRNASSEITLGADSVFTYTIHDNDQSRKIQFATGSSSGDESVTPVFITIELTEVNESDATSVNYAVTGGTATGGGVDFTLENGTATIPAGQMSTTVSIAIIDDELNEEDETIIISLSNPGTNANLGTNLTHTYTILDNDPEPVVAFENTASYGSESFATPGITVVLSTVSGRNVSVDYKVSGGTATGGGVDFTLPDGTLNIPAGQSSGEIFLNIVDDNDIEYNETIEITLYNPVHLELGDDSVHIYTIIDNDNLGPVGPGGVGDGASNMLWLRADRITDVSDGGTITNWLDESGNSAHAYQTDNAKKPTYKASNTDFNNFPTVTFNGSSQWFDLQDSLVADAGNYDCFIVYKSTSTSKQFLFHSRVRKLVLAHEGGGDRAYNDGSARGDEIIGTETKLVMWNLNSSGSSIYESGTQTQSGLAYTQRAISDRTKLGVNEGGGGDRFNGDIAEVIFFNSNVNTVQRKLIENYLGAKYGIAIANDKYDYQATHGYDVAGIGREGLPHIHLAATSDFMTLYNPSGLDSAEFLLFGHNNGSIAAWTSNETPNIEIERLPRQWRVDMTGDVGTVSVTIDSAGLPALSSGFHGLILMVDADGDFSSGVSLHRLTNTGGSVFTASNVSLADGDFISVGAVKNLNWTTGDFNSEDTWFAGVLPQPGQHAYILENTSVTLSADHTLSSLTIGADATLSLGSYELTLNDDGITNHGTLNMNTGTIHYARNGDKTLDFTFFNHLKISGSGTKMLAGNTLINGSLTLENAAALDVSSANNYTLEVKRDWLNNGGTFHARTGTVSLTGNTAQSVTTAGETFYNLTVNNTSSGITLTNDAEITNVLTLTNGIIHTGANNKVNITSSAAGAIANYGITAFINGNLRRAIAADTVNYVFPIGNGAAAQNYFRADVESNALQGINFIDAKFKPLENHNDNDMSVWDVWEHGSLTYTSISNEGVWELEPDAQPTDGTYGIKLYTANLSGLTDYEFAPLKRPVGSAGDAWTTGGGTLNVHSGDCRQVAHGCAYRYGLKSFSEQGVGSGDQDGAGLPIEILHFTAIEFNNTVEVSWSTATETENEYFTVERSVDAIEFEPVKIVPGAGNSSVIRHYSITDYAPLQGVSYYSLKQTDFDGGYEYSGLVSVYIKPQALSFMITPNPVTDKRFYISSNMREPINARLHIIVTDISGRQVYASPLTFQNSTRISIDLPPALAGGIYFISVHHAGEVMRQKLVVE